MRVPCGTVPSAPSKLCRVVKVCPGETIAVAVQSTRTAQIDFHPPSFVIGFLRGETPKLPRETEAYSSGASQGAGKRCGNRVRQLSARPGSLSRHKNLYVIPH